MAQYYNRNMFLDPRDPECDEDYNFEEDYDRWEAAQEAAWESKNDR